MGHLYAIMGKLRLFARERRRPGGRGDGTDRRNYDLPNADFRNPADRPAQQCVDILRAFGEACREDLQRYTRRGLVA
jgi:hypothetical protein